MGKKITYTDEPMEMGERMPDDFLPPPSQLVMRQSTTKGTDWKRLHRKSEAKIRAGIKADPDAHHTDAAFWKGAKVVKPRITNSK